MKGRASRTPAQDLIRDNMQDLGIDSYNMEQEQGPPELYPPAPRPSNPGPISEEDTFCLRKERELSRRFRASAYYLPHKENQGEIKRYSDKYKGSSVADCISAVCSDKESYFSLELLQGVYGKAATGGNSGGGKSRSGNGAGSSGSSSSSSSGGGEAAFKDKDIKGVEQRKRSNSHTAHTLESLARRERSTEGKEGDKGARPGGGADGSDGSGNEFGEEEEENDDDYMKDHNDSDDGGDGDDDDGEQTY